MAKSFIYKSPLLYRLIMISLYGREYFQRFKILAEYIEENSSLIDLCSGFGDFYKYGLDSKNIIYTGVDLSHEFSAYGHKNHINVIKKDIENFSFTPADYYVINDSLYHFQTSAESIVKRMLNSARKKVLVMEPVKNITSSKYVFISKLAKYLTNEGNGKNTFRFSEKSLDDLMYKHFKPNIIESKLTPSGRDKIYVLSK